MSLPASPTLMISVSKQENSYEQGGKNPQCLHLLVIVCLAMSVTVLGQKSTTENQYTCVCVCVCVCVCGCLHSVCLSICLFD